MCVRVIEQIAQEMLGLILEDFKGHLHMVLELLLGSPVWAEDLGKFSYRVPFQPQPFTDSLKIEELVDSLVSKPCFLFWHISIVYNGSLVTYI